MIENRNGELSCGAHQRASVLRDAMMTTIFKKRLFLVVFIPAIQLPDTLSVIAEIVIFSVMYFVRPDIRLHHVINTACRLLRNDSTETIFLADSNISCRSCPSAELH